MKYIKEYNNFDIDPFNEDDWNEVEPDEKLIILMKEVN